MVYVISKKKKAMKKTAFLMILITVVISFSCKKDKTDNNNGKPATLTVLLTDSPVDYNEVNVDVRSVGVHLSGNWYDFSLPHQEIFNLISLSNGTTALLVSGVSVPAGTIDQMRLQLGDSNTVVVDGLTHALKTPSGQTSGYKVKMNAVFEPGGTYQVLLDFDAARSVVREGNGDYLLKPVVNGNLVTSIGKIDGIVVPEAAGKIASAWSLTDTLSVYIDNTTGYFLINSLLPGTYKVKITANAPFVDTLIENVPVLAGQVTHLDSIHPGQ